MSYEDIFDDSYERVLNVNVSRKDFFPTFYQNFLAASDDIAAMFVNTNMARQHRMVKKSFYSLLVFYATNSADDYLEGIAKGHQHIPGIKTEYYDLWLEALLKTVAECDPQYTADIALAWRLVLASGLTYMKHKYPISDV